MKTERIVILSFSVLGVMAGILSSYLEVLLAMPLAIFIYIMSILPSLKFFVGKKRKWLIQNSLITFILMWILVWVLLFTG